MALPQTPDSNPVDYIDEEDFISLEIPPEMAGERLDKVLAGSLPDYSRNRLKTWVEAGAVMVDGKVTKARYLLRGGESIKVFPQEMPEQFAFSSENIPLEVVYEDDAIIVINKPPGLVVHPAAGNWSGTLLNGLLFKYPELKSLPRAGIVHRLDKDTSGLMVVARTAQAQTSLVRQLQDRTVGRRYLAWVWGGAPSQGKVLASVGRDQRDRLKMAAGSPQGKPAATLFRRLAKSTFLESPLALLECRLETGRTHQIRVHLESLGFPLLGDPVYRKKTPGVAKSLLFERQALHAYALSLQHPLTQELVSWFRLPPLDLMQLLRQVGMSEADLPQEATVLASIHNERTHD
ncbi:RluA family pseudouridine synthase [Polynucleobacter sp. AP-Sanab-80-C2]|uniref:RluA family pseudouridine synthase n=1 Tax=Polynucleobacter sp. AP-Sanab-80-C2 TaxID=3108274 RepID=UPI002B232C67|nr:RluA family pseudouridine synthase [Polynucleobacter sp. AP-Sanab-80-C2]MEA9600365.1 RluA family pseudouridine synthase [Polynucleobacter sp. AP-Sanab-80-C2]